MELLTYTKDDRENKKMKHENIKAIGYLDDLKRFIINYNLNNIVIDKLN